MKESCGTVPYMAPEIFKDKGYDNKVDIWSVGIITCVLLTGKFPINFKNEKQFRKDI